MDNMVKKKGCNDIENAAYHMCEAFKSIGNAANEVVEAISAFAKFLTKYYQFSIGNSKKRRLPRKLKKKYKKLGIYEDWKEGKIK